MFLAVIGFFNMCYQPALPDGERKNVAGQVGFVRSFYISSCGLKREKRFSWAVDYGIIALDHSAGLRPREGDREPEPSNMKLRGI